MQHICLIMPDTPLPDPDVVRRFVPRTVVHWLRLLMILFMHHSDRRKEIHWRILSPDGKCLCHAMKLHRMVTAAIVW